MLKKTFFLLLLLSFALNLLALKPVKITGKVSFSQRGDLRFYLYDDYLTNHKTMVAKTTLSVDGSFSVEIPIKETQLLDIVFNNTYGSIFVEPEKKYGLTISADSVKLNWIDAQMIGGQLNIVIENQIKQDLNYKIMLFDWYYDRFISHFYYQIASRTENHTYDSIINILYDKFPYDTLAIDYYNVYVKYKFAMIDLIYYSKMKQKLYDKYLSGDYIHYNNIAYMEFFNAFFELYLYGTSKYVTPEILRTNINEKCNYYALLDYMGKDPLLLNEIIREMVLIKGVEELSVFKEEFNSVNLLKILEQVKETTKFDYVKTMAVNTISELTELAPGSMAPDFELRDVYNAPVKLSSFRGKYVYLHFFSTYTAETMREMLAIKAMYDQFKDSLTVVSIMLDFETSKLYHFVNEFEDFDWTFLHFNGNFDFIDTYKIFSLPMGILIDSSGKIVSCPAKSPTMGLIVQIYSLFPTLDKPRTQKK